MGAGTANSDNIQINDQTSRLGFKGSEDLGDGLKAIFGMEFGVKISTNPNDNEFNVGDTFSARNAFVGMAGDFGTVLVGRHDHPLKISTGSLDFFADSQGDYNNAYAGGLTDLRADGAVAYVSPSFSGFSVIGAMVPGENNQADGIADAYSLAAMYNNAGLFASVAYEEGDKNMDSLNSGNIVTSGSADYEQTRVGLGYTMDALTFNVVWAEMTLENGPVTAVDNETWVISGKYTMGNNAIKAKYFDTDANTSSTSNEDIDGWTLGLEHNFSKRTQAQLLYISSSQDGANAKNDGDIFSMQVNHSF
jgi:predicted porin